MRVAIFLIGLFVLLAGCSYPVILVGPRPKDIPPRIESWVKADTNVERRVQDSIDCKGNALGLPIESQDNLEAVMLPGEKDTRLARSRLFHSWERCMLSKGYQYTGQCYLDDYVSSARPACGAP